MKNKRLFMTGMLVLTLAFAFVIAACGGNKSGSAGAAVIADAAPASDFAYELSEDGKGVVITKYTGEGGDLVIPAEIEGLPVVALGYQAFYGNEEIDYAPLDKIVSVVIPEGVKSIGRYCFQGISKLTSVTILGSEVIIAEKAFADNINLSELNLPENGTLLCDDSVAYENGGL